LPKSEPYYVHREGWTPLPAEPLPRPTYWPAVLATGIMMLLWGSISSPILTVAGAAVFVVAVLGWIKEFLHAGTNHSA
jgi:hypothetical protein